MDRGAWWATVHGVAKVSDMTQQLNNNMYVCVVRVSTHTQSYITFVSWEALYVVVKITGSRVLLQQHSGQ